MAPDLAPAAALVAAHPRTVRQTARGAVSCREAGAGPAICLLHGIGSESGSWVGQLDALAGRFRAIAWDAPGYGASDLLAAATPTAADYAESLAALLDALEVRRAVLGASSLGALIAGAFAARWPERVAGMVLLSPAPGYGRAAPQEREERLAARLARLAALGPAGMAAALPEGMLAPGAAPEARALAAWATAQLRPDGYTQAARMLAHGRLADDAARYAGPVVVVAGAYDEIVPPAQCERLARAFPNATYRLLETAGHLSYLDSRDAVNALLGRFAAQRAGGRG